ncbi:hypothetical protein UVI_02011700 [Ustilaginoidea virens]|uniref:Spo12-like protein n=1 Tax=Ustilaginoidea virens TaxID=1159556 RepID=A0A1B5L1F8_USTVR|nr:hypothetical protein UVI_02011700 [Ustilaginoidea virens]
MVLADRDVNAPVEQPQQAAKDVKSMEYHRQVFHSKMATEPAKPKSLFAQASAKKLTGDNALGARSIQQ